MRGQLRASLSNCDGPMGFRMDLYMLRAASLSDNYLLIAVVFSSLFGGGLGREVEGVWMGGGAQIGPS